MCFVLLAIPLSMHYLVSYPCYHCAQNMMVIIGVHMDLSQFGGVLHEEQAFSEDRHFSMRIAEVIHSIRHLS